jgi:hypothetical protein
MSDYKCYQATPSGTLEEVFMNCNTPLSEREHWARNEIGQLRQRVAELEDTRAYENLIKYGNTHPEMYKTELDLVKEQLAAMTKERDLYKEANAGKARYIESLPHDTSALDALVKDAARYRWIRKCMPFSTLKNITKKYLSNPSNDTVSEELDKAIDEAMKGQE